MTTPDIELILDRWLGEGIDVLPDRSVNAVLRTVERTSQRSAWRVPWRTPDMNGFSRIAVLAGTALVVVLAVGGLVILTGPKGPSMGGNTSPSPAATASPALSASPAGEPTPSPSDTPLGAAIVNLDGTVRQDLELPPGAWAPALSPDGSRVVFALGGKLWVKAVAAGSVAQDIGAGVTGAIEGWSRSPIEAAPAWSPDGTRIAYASGGDIFVFAADGSGPPRQVTTDPQLDQWPAWTPDGTTIIYVNSGSTPLDESAISPTQEIWRVPASGGKPKRVTKDGVAELQPDIARDGTMVVWQDGTIRAMDPANGRSTTVTNPIDGTNVVIPEGWNPRWSPDGSKLALLTYDASKRTTFHPADGLPSDYPLMQVHIIDLTTGGETALGPRVAAFWNPVSWTPDGQALLVNRYDCVADGTGGACP